MKKMKKLESILRRMQGVVVAYSGGLDSTFLLKAALDVLGKRNVLAVTARSETYPAWEYREAVRLVKRIGARQVTIRTGELASKNFRSNPVNRCYYCKKELFRRLDSIRKKYGFKYVIDGTNLDDLKDIRHGRKAALESRVCSPLLEALIKKSDIRKFSRKAGLSTWNKPSYACLASRIPFNSRITESLLKRVEESEDYLRSLGFRQVRARLHGPIARIEVEKRGFTKALKYSSLIVKKFKQLGFIYVTLDLAGYRTGSLHEAVK